MDKFKTGQMVVVKDDKSVPEDWRGAICFVVRNRMSYPIPGGGRVIAYLIKRDGRPDRCHASEDRLEAYNHNKKVTWADCAWSPSLITINAIKANRIAHLTLKGKSHD
jgi:hypothetical protein